MSNKTQSPLLHLSLTLTLTHRQQWKQTFGIAGLRNSGPVPYWTILRVDFTERSALRPFEILSYYFYFP